MDMSTRVQTLNEAVTISKSANALEKGMHPTILPPTMGKQWGRLGSLNLLSQLVWEKENRIETC